MKKTNKKIAGLTLLFLIGLSILLYPTISNIWNQYCAQQLITEYGEALNQESSIEYQTVRQQAETYNQNLIGESVPDAFASRENIEDANYESQLNILGEGMMGYVEMPAIAIRIPIYHYTTEDVLKKGAGHLIGSSLPIGGESTHAVISAHRGLPSAKLFSDLNLAQENDRFYINILDEKLAYEIDQILTVEPEEVQSLAITEGKDEVTLVTCTPYGVNTQRILVRGHRVAYEESEGEKAISQTVLTQKTSLLIQSICIVIGVALAVIIVICINWIKRRKRLD